jgi:hypothetical protein
VDPLITLKVYEQLHVGLRAGAARIDCSLDLERSIATVELDAEGWTVAGRRFPYPDTCKDRTVYYWKDGAFQPVSRFTASLIKLVPTDWGPPTFEIDGIKMLPTATVSPYADAERKVGLIQPRGKIILDTCGGLGYFAAWCLRGQAQRVHSYEKNPDVIWLRRVNPWSPEGAGGNDERLTLTLGDIAEHIPAIPDGSVDAILHDPPRFGIAGELYSQVFYDHLARVIKRRGRLFHYTGSPNKITSGRDVASEVAQRLRRAGFDTQLDGDGVLAVRGGRR